jgi:hypothetical protein
MSIQTEALNNGQQAIVNTNTAKIFLWNRRSAFGTLNNSYYAALRFLLGTVMARVSATNLIVPFVSTGLDGRQYPIGVLMVDYLVAAGANQVVYYMDDGDVAEEQLVFYNGFDTLNTAVSGRTVRDMLKAAGIKCIPATETTNYDNQ